MTMNAVSGFDTGPIEQHLPWRCESDWGSPYEIPWTHSCRRLQGSSPSVFLQRRFRVREVLNISLKNSNPPVYPFSHDLKDFIHERKRDRARISRPLGTSEAPLAGKTLEEPRLVKRVAAGYSENIRLSRSFVSTSRECRSRKSSRYILGP